jgi:hypothetical protein
MPLDETESGLRWKDQTGRVWRIPEMSTSHIKNSMRFLLRRAQILHDERTVLSLSELIADPSMMNEATDAVETAMQEYMFGHLAVKPKEWVRRLDIMWAFHHELARRRDDDRMRLETGEALFEFPR